MGLFLSLCMIVKDEEEVLARCLESVKDYVDEMIIVDTGSKDKTKKIALNYTSKVFDYKWDNNFANARNFAHSKATGKWIIYLDADEFIDGENFKTTVTFLKEQNDSSCDGYIVEQINYLGNYGEAVNRLYTIRLYKNDPAIEFYRAVHEQLRKHNGDVELTLGKLDLKLYHTGYLKETVGNKNKNARNTPLIEQELRNNEKNGFDYYNLGNEYLYQEQIEKALDAYQKAFQYKESIKQIWVPNAVEQIIICLVNLGRYKEALNVVEEASKYWDRAADFICLRSQIYLRQNRFDEAEKELCQLLENKNEYTVIMLLDYLESLPYKFSGQIFEQKKEFNKAVYYYSTALKFNKNDFKVLSRLCTLIVKYEDTSNVINFISKNVDPNIGISKVVLIKNFIDNSSVQLLEYFIDQWNLKDSHALKLQLALLNQDFKTINCLLNKYELENILDEGWINELDILIFSLENNDNQLFATMMQYGDLNYLEFLNADIKPNDNEPTRVKIIKLLERCIKLGKFELFENIIWKTVDQISLYQELGNLLYKYDFKELAIQFYDEIKDLSTFDEQAFVNIIEYLSEQNNPENALQFAYMAIEQNKIDYRIFKTAIAILDKMEIHDDRDKLIDLALEFFPDSNVLKLLKGGQEKIICDQKERFTKRVILKDDMSINVFSNDFIGRIIGKTNDYYERVELDTFLKYIPKNTVIYDIGTNIGNHTLYFSKYASPSKIYAFEPIEKVYKVLSLNLEENNINNVEIIKAAVSDKNVKGNMYIQRGNIGASHLFYSETGNVNVVKLDDMKLTPPDFIKIDIENFEYEAIAGMENILRKHQPILWIEIRDKNVFKVKNKLEELGYKQIEEVPSGYDYSNYIFVS